MANHKSAEKRSRQTIRKTKVNKILLSQVKTNLNKLKINIKDKNIDEISKSLSLFNTAISKAVKKGIIKKRNAARKLSSLSNNLKKNS